MKIRRGGPPVKTEKWMLMTIILTLIVSMVSPLTTQAAAKETIEDESIYDLLVDRYFNKTIENDFEVDTQIPGAFAGGDFMGVVEKLDHIEKLGFSMISLGPVFSTETYDGKRVLDYEKLERHFGTSKELNTLIDKVHQKNMSVIVDFPIQNVSSKHVFASNEDNNPWIIENTDGTISFDFSNEDAQQVILRAVLAFVKQYKVDGLRLTAIEDVDTDFLNTIIDALKEENEDFYVLSNEPSEALFDAKVSTEQEEQYRHAFKTVDNEIEVAVPSQDKPVIQQIDSLNSRRFTADAAESNMFPPTRLKMAMATILSIPGVPLMTYGSEIAVNGEQPPESHQLMDFNTDEELVEFIGDVQKLRNGSSALRTGAIEMLHNETGLMIYKRSNEKESWIVAINNTGGTQSFDLPREVIGDNKELKGLFESDILRQKDDGTYKLVLSREIAEFYLIKDKKGFNKAYMAALALVYILFLVFIYLVWRKGRQKKREGSLK
jgi:cyclomaltodextrinase / maltogenic alpha-amylase / neopullulanase